MTVVISFKADIVDHPEFPTTQALKDYVENLLIIVVEDGSFDEQLISLAKDEGLSPTLVSMLMDAKTERVEYTPVLVSGEESTKNESSKTNKSTQIGVAIGSFTFFVLVLSFVYYLYMKSKGRIEKANIQANKNVVWLVI